MSEGRSICTLSFSPRAYLKLRFALEKNSKMSSSATANPINNTYQPPLHPENSSHPQSTIDTFTATPSTLRRASVSPPASLQPALAHLINRSVSSKLFLSHCNHPSLFAFQLPIFHQVRRFTSQFHHFLPQLSLSLRFRFAMRSGRLWQDSICAPSQDIPVTRTQTPNASIIILQISGC